MGFLDKLQDIGIGNRGPYGRMQSGASYLTGKMDELGGRLSTSGVNKAIAAAATKGEILPDTMIEISDRWGVPLQEIRRLAEDHNEQWENKKLQEYGVAFLEYVENKREKEPDFKLTPASALKITETIGANEPRWQMAILGMIQKMNLGPKEPEIINVPQGTDMLSISGNKVTPIYSNEKDLKQQADIEKYEYAKEQYKKGIGPDPGSLTEWIKSIKKSGATSVNVNTGKTLPAEQAGKIGEFATYVETIDQIQMMVDKGTIDTGPFEFIKKRADDWGVLPKKTRIELRTLVARLPGLMYAMRGKQLSDKELEVALEMMPKMSQDETAFAISLKNFGAYMLEVLAGKKAAFSGSGYSTGGFPQQDSKGRPPLSSFER